MEFVLNQHELEKKALSTWDPMELYLVWNLACESYDRGEIHVHTLEEVKDIILPRLKSLKELKETIMMNTKAQAPDND